ncbi:MAG: hypothetical protein ACE366_00295 [Bradymonadia bacterium]
MADPRHRNPRRPLRRAACLSLSAFAVACLAFSGCSKKTPTGASAPPPMAPTAKAEMKSATKRFTPVYSPFAVRVQGPYWADVISFKDVGLKVKDQDTRTLWLEALADGLVAAMEQPVAAELMVEGAPSFTSLSPEKFFSPELASPAAHTHCEGRHIYVDVWRSSSPERVGFSLWKGCSAEDKFMWREIPGERFGDRAIEDVDTAARLGAYIAGALAECPEAHCG